MKKKLFFLTCVVVVILIPFQVLAVSTNTNDSTQTSNNSTSPNIQSGSTANSDSNSSSPQQQNLNSIETNKTNNQNELQQVQQAIDSTEKTIMGIENQLSETQSKIVDTELQIESLTKNIIQIQNNINIKTSQLNDQKKKLGETISFMYENRNLSFFQFFFQTSNLKDLFNTLDFINIIADENDKLYKNVQTQETDLNNQKAKLENDKKIIETEQSSLITLSNQQIKEKSDQSAILVQNQQHELEIQNEIQSEDSAEQNILSEIDNTIGNLPNNQGSDNIPLNPNQTLAFPMKAGTYTISSLFGYRVQPVTGGKEFHDGIDMAATSGTNIYSAGTGTIIFSGPADGFGNWIVIHHDNGLYTIYGHMYSNSLYVKVGQRVQQGQLIAAVGDAGDSTGFHLHFGCATSFNGSSFNYIDPLSVLK